MGKYVHFTDILSADNGSYQKLDYTAKSIQARSMAFFEIMMIIHKFTLTFIFRNVAPLKNFNAETRRSVVNRIKPTNFFQCMIH